MLPFSFCEQPTISYMDYDKKQSFVIIIRCMCIAYFLEVSIVFITFSLFQKFRNCPRKISTVLYKFVLLLLILFPLQLKSRLSPENFLIFSTSTLIFSPISIKWFLCKTHLSEPIYLLIYLTWRDFTKYVDSIKFQCCLKHCFTWLHQIEFRFILETVILAENASIIVIDHQSYRMSYYVVTIEKLDCLYLCRLSCFKCSIIALQKIENLR